MQQNKTLWSESISATDPHPFEGLWNGIVGHVLLSVNAYYTTWLSTKEERTWTQLIFTHFKLLPLYYHRADHPIVWAFLCIQVLLYVLAKMEIYSLAHTVWFYVVYSMGVWFHV